MSSIGSMAAKLKNIVTGGGPPKDVEIRYIIFGGIDYRVDKRLHILGDGSVKYSTIGDELATPIEEEGEYTIKLSEEEVIELLRCFYENGFLEMEQKGRLEPDSVYSEICLKIGKEEKCIYYYHEEDMQRFYKMVKPPEYRRIEEKLREVINKAKLQKRLL